jgi:FkbM family methyltransferase
MPAAAPWGTYLPNATTRTIIALSRHSPLGRGILGKQLRTLLKRLHSGPVDSELWGLKVRLFPDRNNIERKALLRPNWVDPVEYGEMRQRMRQPNAVFVDVGANAGLYSLHAALHAGPGSRILAIEPDATLLSRLQFNFAQARQAGSTDPSTGLVTECSAVGDHDGEALLSTTKSEGGRSLVSGSGRPVRLRRLVSVLDEYGIDRITVLKIDVEGYEDRVLPPYLAAVPEHRLPGAIIIEHAHRAVWSTDCIADCQRRGYRVVITTRNNTILERIA